MTVDRQPNVRIFDRHTATIIMTPMNLLKLLVDGSSDGYANTVRAALLSS